MYVFVLMCLVIVHVCLVFIVGVLLFLSGQKLDFVLILFNQLYLCLELLSYCSCCELGKCVTD